MTPRSGSDPSIDSSIEIFQLWKSKNSQYLDSASSPFGSAQNDSILRGFLNSDFDVWQATLKCFLLVVLHEGHACLKLQDRLYVKNPQYLDSATPPFGSAQSDSILEES